MPNLKIHPSGVEIAIKVTIKASCNELVGWEENVLKIRLKAIPQKGEANDLLIEFIAKTLEIGKSKIELIAGRTSKQKRLLITGVDANYVIEKCNRKH